MRQIKCILTVAFFIVLTNGSFGQQTDSTQNIGMAHRDTFYIIHENVAKNKLLGNSWYFSTSYNYSKTNEFDINIGRTLGTSMCGGAGCFYSIRSWGVGYGLTNKLSSTNQVVKAFWEFSLFYFPPVGLRADYIYDITNNTHYLRPSAGLSLFYVDIFYNYSFNVSGTDNLFKHGVTLRIKYFHKQKNWQKNYPNRC